MIHEKVDLYVTINGKLLACATDIGVSLFREPVPQAPMNIVRRRITGRLSDDRMVAEHAALEQAFFAGEELTFEVRVGDAEAVISQGHLRSVNLSWDKDNGAVCNFEFVGNGKPPL